MRCSLEFLEELLLFSSMLWFCCLILVLPRTNILHLLSEPKSWKYSSRNPHDPKEFAISSPDLLLPTQGLRCFDYGWGEGVARVSNHTPENEASTCLTCERYRYFEYAGEEALFKFDAFAKELEDIDAANKTASQRVRPFGGKCLDHSYRPEGCYLLLHTRIDFLNHLLLAIVKIALRLLGFEDVDLEDSHESILTMNSLEDLWLLRWEVSAIRFTHGEVDALHQVCYCREDFCNGDFEVIVQKTVKEESKQLEEGEEEEEEEEEQEFIE